MSKHWMRKKTRSPKDHISDRKEACDSKWNRNGRSVSVHDTLYYLDCWSFRLWQDLFHRIFTLGSFGRIVRKLSPYDSLLLRGVARWIPRRERRWCTISRRDSYHLPSAQMVPKGDLLVLCDLIVEEGEDTEWLDLFTKHSSHHQNITLLYLCKNIFHREIQKRVFPGMHTTS